MKRSHLPFFRAFLGALATLAVGAAGAGEGQGFLYGQVMLDDGSVHEGRLRFGGREEAFWSEFFNGRKARNPWAPLLPPGALDAEAPKRLFGIALGGRAVDLERPFMVRFGDIARIEARGRDLAVTLRSGRVVELDRFEADDFADGLAIHDAAGGAVKVGEWRIRSLSFAPTPTLRNAPPRLHGTIETARAAFAGHLQWDREAGVATDELRGRDIRRGTGIRFEELDAILGPAQGAPRAIFLDGRMLDLAGEHDIGAGHRGVYVNDPRYGRVLVPWREILRVDFSAAADSGPAYGDFPPTHPLAGEVRARDGRRLAGRLVFDLDEAETSETLDAPALGVDFTIPFARVRSLDLEGPGPVGVVLAGGERLELERRGDLSDGNAGLLVFAHGEAAPVYLPWRDVARIDFSAPDSAPVAAEGGPGRLPEGR